MTEAGITFFQHVTRESEYKTIVPVMQVTQVSVDAKEVGNDSTLRSRVALARRAAVHRRRRRIQAAKVVVAQGGGGIARRVIVAGRSVPTTRRKKGCALLLAGVSVLRAAIDEAPMCGTGPMPP